MGRNTSNNANGKEMPPLQHRSRTSGKGGSSFGQLSCGRRILASKYQQSGRRTTSTSSVWRENHTQSRIEVHLKETTGMRVGRGVQESELKTGDDVAGLVLFPHHIAVRVMEVYACGGHESTEDGQVLRDCIGEIVRWSSSFVEPIDMVPGGTRSKTSTSEAFDFNEDNPLKETIIPRNMVECEELDEFQSLDPSGTEENMANAQTTCSIFGVEGLPSNLQKKKYTMTKRVRKEKQQRRIGSSREEKVSLANVQHDMQSSICSKGCMKKLDARAILMKRFRAWGSHEYEVRASWILENLTDCYNKEKDKFETQLCGVFICNGCYAVALGYSKRRIEELKSDIRSIGITSEVFGVECSGRSSAVHGNTVHVPRTSVGVQAMESVFEKYVTETGCTQPHRQCRRRSDNQMVPLILLPMNTRRDDMYHTVVADVERITKSKAPGPCSFYRLWRTEYTHVQIPPHSRFSKCQTCWEYRTCWEASTMNSAQKQLVRERLNLHQAVQVEERKDYWRAKQNAILYPKESMCLIVDGMDQNTTMVPKLRQAVKGIEGRYVKTHLCGILVHGEGLYSDVWIDSHHKHDSNQVITSIMNVINDVRDCRGGLLPPVLRIQADNCGRENKNQYMFALCAALVGLGYFAEVYLSFLLVGHTHEDIDKRFSVISNTLKHHDINSMQELMELIQKGASHTEAFISVRHLEYVWDWKKFSIPYLYNGPNTFVGISTKHHFKFYLKEKTPFVQTKDYVRDPLWEPAEGCQCLTEVPSLDQKPSFVDVYEANDQEMKALEEFIKMKKRCIMKLMYVERNLRAIEDTKWLM